MIYPSLHSLQLHDMITCLPGGQRLAARRKPRGGWGSWVRMGRKRLLSAQQAAHARKLIEQGEGPDNVAQSLKVSRRMLYRALAASRLCQVKAVRAGKLSSVSLCDIKGYEQK